MHSEIKNLLCVFILVYLFIYYLVIIIFQSVIKLNVIKVYYQMLNNNWKIVDICYTKFVFLHFVVYGIKTEE